MRRGFTLIELLIGTAIMLVVVVGAMALYVRSNKISADQQQYAEVQQDVRTSMFFITRDGRMAGVGMPTEFDGYFVEGVDNDTTDTAANVTPDRIKMIGNMDEPLVLRIQSYQGSSAEVTLEDHSLEQYSYPDQYYEQKYVIIFPNPASGCWAAEPRIITHVTHDTGGTNEKVNFSPGLAPGVDPPGGLAGTCPDSDDYDGGYIAQMDLKEYWLDVTGAYPGLTPGVNGYIGGGVGGVLYLVHNTVNYPLARNIENLQFQYNGDFDNDGQLDGYQDWNPIWTPADVGRLISIRVLILGRCPNPSASVSGTPAANLYLYRRPALANTTAADADDKHRRFLLESTSTVRNMTLNLYETGLR